MASYLRKVNDNEFLFSFTDKRDSRLLNTTNAIQETRPLVLWTSEFQCSYYSYIVTRISSLKVHFVQFYTEEHPQPVVLACIHLSIEKKASHSKYFKVCVQC